MVPNITLNKYIYCSRTLAIVLTEAIPLWDIVSVYILRHTQQVVALSIVYYCCVRLKIYMLINNCAEPPAV